MPSSNEQSLNGLPTKNDSRSVSSSSGNIIAYDHLTFWVGNAKQAATYYCVHFGFRPIAYSGLETGSRERVFHVVQLNRIILVFVSPIEPNTSDNHEMNAFLAAHGDGVKDVAFRVDNLDSCVERALSQGAKLVGKSRELSSLTSPNRVKMATIQTFGDVTHTFVERDEVETEMESYFFLPGFVQSPMRIHTIISQALVDCGLEFIDHVVGHFPQGQLESITEWYERSLAFHRFWSVDENILHTDYSGIRSHIVTNGFESIKMPLCEVVPGPSSKKGHEFIYYNGNRAGIHHIAFHTEDIVTTVSRLRGRGVDFLHTPDTYYDLLIERLAKNPVKPIESIDELKKNRILVDFDENGYLLQIFTKPLQDRPTLVLEVIQRRNHWGFGAGNFLALFKAIEAETQLRGNLQ